MLLLLILIFNSYELQWNLLFKPLFDWGHEGSLPQNNTKEAREPSLDSQRRYSRQGRSWTVFMIPPQEVSAASQKQLSALLQGVRKSLSSTAGSGATAQSETPAQILHALAHSSKSQQQHQESGCLDVWHQDNRCLDVRLEVCSTTEASEQRRVTTSLSRM